MDRKLLIIIIVVGAGSVASGLAVYAFTYQQNIEAQYKISHAEQCNQRVQSLNQRAQDAIDSGEYGQWRSGVVNEIQQLNKDCPEQTQEQQQ